jgi:hypothetical protein
MWVMVMFRFVVDDNNEVYNFIIDKLENGVYPNDLTLGIYDDNILIGGVLYSLVNDICYISFYAKDPKWATKKNLSFIFALPFNKFQSKIVKCCTSSKNKRVNKLLWGLKLRHEAHLRFGRLDGTDENVFSITEDELKQKRWYK